MSEFYKHDDGSYRYREEDEDLDVVLDQDNFMFHYHRQEHLKDRLAVQDPRDEIWTVLWRYDMDPENFEKVEKLALAIGTVILRDTALPDVEEMFDDHHKFEDEDYEELLDGTE